MLKARVKQLCVSTLLYCLLLGLAEALLLLAALGSGWLAISGDHGSGWASRHWPSPAEFTWAAAYALRLAWRLAPVYGLLLVIAMRSFHYYGVPDWALPGFGGLSAALISYLVPGPGDDFLNFLAQRIAMALGLAFGVWALPRLVTRLEDRPRRWADWFLLGWVEGLCLALYLALQSFFK